MGRKPIFEESFVMRTRIESSVYDKIPGKKAPFVRAAINEKMARETTKRKSICEEEKNISSELGKKDQEIKRLNQLVTDYKRTLNFVAIEKTCPHCSKPMLDGYVCPHCGKDPEDNWEEA